MIERCLPDPQNPSLLMLKKLNADSFFAEHYEKDAGVIQGYTLLEHTAMVLGQFEKYFASRPWNAVIALDVFRLMLCLHDIGKPIAVENGDKKLQHGFTLGIIDQAVEFEKISLSSEELSIIKAIVNGDAIGTLLKGQKTLEESVAQIKERAKEANLSVEDFFQLLVIYYQSDAGSYTQDAGGVRALDFLFLEDDQKKCFVFNDQESRLYFSEQVEEKFAILQQNLFNPI